MKFAFRHLTLGVFFVLGFSCVSPKGFLPYEGLKGNPTEVKILDFLPIAENSSQEPQLSSWVVYQFDEAGRKVRYQVFRSDSTPVNGGSKFYYPERGPVQYQLNYNVDGELRSRTDFTYDKKWRLLKSRTVAGGEEVSTKEISYDPKKPISYTKIIYNGKTLVQNSVDQLDKKGRMILMTDYHSNGALKGKLGYTYDKNGNEILQEWYNSEGKLFQFFKKAYNENNDPILNEEFKIISGEPLKTSETPTEYLYDSFGNQSQVMVRSQGKVFIKKVEVSYPNSIK